jgi:hypothetical protein
MNKETIIVHAIATMLIALMGTALFLSLANGQAQTTNDDKTLLNGSSDDTVLALSQG